MNDPELLHVRNLSLDTPGGRPLFRDLALVLVVVSHDRDFLRAIGIERRLELPLESSGWAEQD